MTRPFMLVMLSNFAYFLAVGATLPVLPRFVEGPLAGGSVAVGLAMGTFSLAAVLLRPFTGRIGDTRGRRVLIIVGGLLVGGSLVGYVFTASLLVLFLLRLVSGAGEALFYVGTASAINDLAPDERRGEALSYFSLSLFAGIGLGPILGEIVLDAAGFDAAWIVAALCSVFAGAIGFFVVETRPIDPDVAPSGKLVATSALLPGTVMAASIWGLAMFSTFVPLYALALGLSGSRFLFALHSGVVFAIRLFGARLPDLLGPAKAATGALACSVLGFIAMAAWRSPTGLVVGTVVWSLGHSLAFPALMSMAVKGAPASERGAVVGTFTAFFDLSFGVGAVAAGGIVHLFGYSGGFLSASIAAGAGLLLLSARRQRARRISVSTATL
ncbi:MAG TPA: MFS transporter [Actinomycetota bacterium]|nr:MFS transporter [Actinomycetota bacterium]